MVLSVTPNYTLSRNNPLERFYKSVLLCYRSSSLDQKNSTSSTTEGSKTQDSGQTSNNQGKKGLFFFIFISLLLSLSSLNVLKITTDGIIKQDCKFSVQVRKPVQVL